MAFATNVRRHFVTVSQSNPANLAQRRVRLLGRGGIDAGANAAALGASLERGHNVLFDLALAGLAYELANSGHLRCNSL